MTSESSPSFDEIAEEAAELRVLKATAAAVLTRAWPPGSYRNMLGGPVPAFPTDLWATLVNLGWVDVLVSGEHGGGGSSLSHLCALTEAAGSALAPTPLAAAAAAAWCEGKTADGTSLVLPAAGELSDGKISGRWPVVPYGGVAQRLLCLASDTGGNHVLAAVDANGLGSTVDAVVPLDRNPAARVTLAHAPAAIVLRGPDAVARHHAALMRARLAAMSELIGVADAANAAASDYARTRVAFGRPIGSFQAVKHRLVDQRTAIEVGRALLHRAAAAVERRHPDRSPLASLALFWAIDALRSIAEGAIQVFGGIGCTWEHDAHAYLRRSACLVASLGSRAEHRANVVSWLRAVQNAGPAGVDSGQPAAGRPPSANSGAPGGDRARPPGADWDLSAPASMTQGNQSDA